MSSVANQLRDELTHNACHCGGRCGKCLATNLARELGLNSNPEGHNQYTNAGKAATAEAQKASEKAGAGKGYSQEKAVAAAEGGNYAEAEQHHLRAAEHHDNRAKQHRQYKQPDKERDEKAAAAAHREAAGVHHDLARDTGQIQNDANFSSEQQRKFMWSQHPEIAQKWAHGEHTSDTGPHHMPSGPGKDVKGPQAKQARKKSKSVANQLSEVLNGGPGSGRHKGGVVGKAVEASKAAQEATSKVYSGGGHGKPGEQAKDLSEEAVKHAQDEDGAAAGAIHEHLAKMHGGKDGADHKAAADAHWRAASAHAEVRNTFGPGGKNKPGKGGGFGAGGDQDAPADPKADKEKEQQEAVGRLAMLGAYNDRKMPDRCPECGGKMINAKCEDCDHSANSDGCGGGVQSHGIKVDGKAPSGKMVDELGRNERHIAVTSEQKCPACGQDMQDGKCACGYAVENATPYKPEAYDSGDEEETESVKCPKCDKGNEPDAKYCDQCGLKLVGRTDVKNSKHDLRHQGTGQYRAVGSGDGRGAAHDGAVTGHADLKLTGGHKNSSYAATPGLSDPTYDDPEFEPAEDELHEDDAPAKVVGHPTSHDGRHIVDVSKVPPNTGVRDDAGHSAEGNEKLITEKQNVTNSQVQNMPQPPQPQQPSQAAASTPHEATTTAAKASLDTGHEDSMAHSLRAVKHSGNEDSTRAASAHTAAAESHEGAATKAIKDGDHDDAVQHVQAAGLHRAAADQHAPPAPQEQPTGNSNPEGHNQYSGGAGKTGADAHSATQKAVKLSQKAFGHREGNMNAAENLGREGHHLDAANHLDRVAGMHEKNAAAAKGPKTKARHEEAAKAVKEAASAHREAHEVGGKPSVYGTNNRRGDRPVKNKKRADKAPQISVLNRSDLIQILTANVDEEQASVLNQLPEATLRQMVTNANRMDVAAGESLKTTWQQMGGKGEEDEYWKRGVKIGIDVPTTGPNMPSKVVGATANEDDDDDECPECGGEMEDGKCEECGYTANSQQHQIQNQRMLKRLLSADPYFKDIYETGVQNRQKELRTLLRRLTSNVRDPKRRQAVADKLVANNTIEDLRLMAEGIPDPEATQNALSLAHLRPVADLGGEIQQGHSNIQPAGEDQRRPVYVGAAGGQVTDNQEGDGALNSEEPLTIPVWNAETWLEVSNENSGSEIPKRYLKHA